MIASWLLLLRDGHGVRLGNGGSWRRSAASASRALSKSDEDEATKEARDAAEELHSSFSQWQPL